MWSCRLDAGGHGELPPRCPGGSRVREPWEETRKLSVGSRWYCRHQHAFSRYFQLPTRVCCCAARGTIATCFKNGQRPGTFAPSLRWSPVRNRRRKYCLLHFDGRASGLEVLLHLLGVVLRDGFLHGRRSPSTRSLASFRPRPVMARTALMTSTFFSPAAFRMTLNSVCSSTGAAAAAGPAAS